MSLRDELIRTCGNAGLVAILWPDIERALAAERAATVAACAALFGDNTLMEEHFPREAAAIVRDIVTLVPRDRSALEGATKMAAAQARHEINQKTGEHLGQDANEKSLLQMLDDALAQARREQREKDAMMVKRKFGYSGVGHDTYIAEDVDSLVNEIVAAIRAQED